MLTANGLLPATVTGSWPRPAWYTTEPGGRPFSNAMLDVRYREQFLDAVNAVITDQQRAGLDILTNGDYRIDGDVGGGSWRAYPSRCLSGTSDVDVEHRRHVAGRQQPARASRLKLMRGIAACATCTLRP
jgi:hypothetical protein